MKKALLISAMVSVVSLSANAQAHKPKDRLANIELTATQRTSIDSVKKVYDEKKKAVKKDASLSKEQQQTKTKALQKEQVMAINSFLTKKQKKEIKSKNKEGAKKDN